MLNWPILKQIFDLCFIVMRFIYDNISSNVGVAVMLYALFIHVLFIPFSIKSRIDKKRNGKASNELKQLWEEFSELPEDVRSQETVRTEFKEKEQKLKKKRVSFAESCLVIIIRMFALLAATPVIAKFESLYEERIGSEIVLNYNFLGLDLSAAAPGYSLHPTVILPLITTIILAVPGFITTIKNMRDRKIAQAAKSPEQLEEEAKMLKEMGIKDTKIPWGIIIQLGFAWFYFNSFSKLALTVSLFWGTYYLINFVIREVISYVFVKIAQQLRKKQRKKCHA